MSHIFVNPAKYNIPNTNKADNIIIDSNIIIITIISDISSPLLSPTNYILIVR